MAIPHVDEWEVDNTWRVLEDKYDTKQEMAASCLAKGLILFTERHGILRESLDDYSDDEFVEMVFQMKMTRPELELIALGDFLVELVGKDHFSQQAEPDLEKLIHVLHELGGVEQLRQLWLARGGGTSRVIGSPDKVRRL